MTGPDDNVESPAEVAERARLAIVRRLLVIDAKLAALDRWDELGATVAQAEDREDALSRLRELGFDRFEADHVLDMSLAGCTNLARREMERERAHLREQLGETNG